MKGSCYPSWRYHRTLEPRLVKDSVEDKELGNDWSDTPADFEKSEEKPVDHVPVEPESNPVEPSEETAPVEPEAPKPKRKRRTKAEMEASK